MLRKTLILDDIFDATLGWPYPIHQVPLERLAAPDGSPYYQLRVDGVNVFVIEQTEWADENRRSDISASRLCVIVPTDFENMDAVELLLGNADTHGLPGWSVDEDGDIVLTHALPFSENFPVDWLRKQMLVSIGLAVEGVREVAAVIVEGDEGRTARRWTNAREVASVAGSFARAFVLL
ncbi:hypothetical protein ACFFOM_20605 [Microlunatus capsulatus]|uniref:Uncharacterized protein n=1 Tax=Microlunatus capsulatus TaxID=99117 RepID=A0ABS4ZF96_9ACTN|nr:hypothetical protein [Microlunatus capsulatus]MBP2418903.1 hypothetical protein [Microlunatus capsulatus]